MACTPSTGRVQSSCSGVLLYFKGATSSSEEAQEKPFSSLKSESTFGKEAASKQDKLSLQTEQQGRHRKLANQLKAALRGAQPALFSITSDFKPQALHSSLVAAGLIFSFWVKESQKPRQLSRCVDPACVAATKHSASDRAATAPSRLNRYSFYKQGQAPAYRAVVWQQQQAC